jgi:hypothetical protein
MNTATQSVLNEIGARGAKRASYRDINPRKALAKIIDDNPKGPETVWRTLFHELAVEDSDYAKAIIEWWLDNNLKALMTKEDALREARAAASAAKPPTKDAIKSTLREHINHQAQIILLDLLMPNGKKLALCTGRECGKFGGWFTALADKVPANKAVSDVLSEGEVRKIWLAKK